MLTGTTERLIEVPVEPAQKFLRQGNKFARNEQFSEAESVFRAAASLPDDEGNQIAKTAKNSRTEYFWDHRNRLVNVVDNGKSVEYDYDYQNRLVRRNDELFVHDGWQIASMHARKLPRMASCVASG